MVGTKPICEPTMRRRASAWRSSATLCTTSVIVVERTWNSSGHVIEVAEHLETVVAELASPMTRDDVGRQLLERRERRTGARACSGCGIFRSGSSTVTPSIQMMSTSSVRGPQCTSRSRPAAVSSRVGTPRAARAGERLGVELDDHVEVRRPARRAADGLGLVDGRHGDDVGERRRWPRAGARAGLRGSTRGRGTPASLSAASADRDGRRREVAAGPAAAACGS